MVTLLHSTHEGGYGRYESIYIGGSYVYVSLYHEGYYICVESLYIYMEVVLYMISIQ